MDRALTILVHGLSKAGKSTFSVTAPAPRLYLDVESASRFLPITRIVWDNLNGPPPAYDGTWDTCVVPTRDWDTVSRVYQWLQAGQHPFRSLIIDSISELQQRYIEKVSGRSQMNQQQWGDTFRAVSGLLRDIRDLTMHPTHPIEAVVMTSMTKHVDNMWRPYVQGQLAAVMPYLFDVNGYLYVDQEINELTATSTEVRRLLTRRDAQFEAGERVQGRIPPVMTNPSVSEMLDMIFGPVPGATAAAPAAADETPATAEVAPSAETYDAAAALVTETTGA